MKVDVAAAELGPANVDGGGGGLKPGGGGGRIGCVAGGPYTLVGATMYLK